MEAFESFIALTMEADSEDGRLVVSEAIKFPVVRQTAKASRVEIQTHGFEVDLVGARQDRLVLATVKSFFGSRGVVAEHVIGNSQTKRFNSLYALINDPVVRDAVVDEASQRYGYPIDQVELRFYVGKFAGGKTAEHERRIREWAATQIVYPTLRQNPQGRGGRVRGRVGVLRRCVRGRGAGQHERDRRPRRCDRSAPQ